MRSVFQGCLEHWLEHCKMLVVGSGIGVVKTEGHSSRRDVLVEG